jgi:hypothetical protein
VAIGQVQIDQGEIGARMLAQRGQGLLEAMGERDPGARLELGEQLDQDGVDDRVVVEDQEMAGQGVSSCVSRSSCRVFESR